MQPTLQSALSTQPSRPVTSLPREVAARVESYKLAHIETATPERLVVMLYEGAIRFLHIAVQALADRQLDTANGNILKAEAIVLELMSVLDRDLGGEIAANLSSLYDYIYRQLVKGNLAHDPEPLLEVIGLLENLRSAWDEAAQMVAQMRANGQFEGATPGGLNFAG